MILDEGSTRSVSSALTMFEIMERNVSLVENLAMGRQPFKDMDALYFISPTLESAQWVMADFVSKERAPLFKRPDNKETVPVTRYARAHIVFTGTIDKPILDSFQTNDLLLSRIKTFKEIHFDFLAPESWVYHLDLPESFPRLFVTPTDILYTNTISTKLASMCITLKEFPNVRYQSASPVARAIATKLVQLLSEYKKANSAFVAYGEDASEDRERGQLVIVDRLFDPLTPLMHEYTYQAMANDLLTLDQNGMIHYETTTEKGNKVNKEAILNSEADELWLEQRHKHIAAVISSLKERMDDILQTNSGAKLLKKKGGDLDMTTMASAVKNLPQYQQLMTDLGRHVAVATLCMKEFSTQNLLEISAVEQTLSSGVSEEGQPVKGRKATELLASFFSNSSNTALSKYLKTRLLLIYFITQRPISVEDRKTVVGAAQLTNADQQVIFKLSTLLDNTQFDGDILNLGSGTINSVNPVAAKQGFFSSIFGGRATKEAEKIASTAEGDYTDTRHVSTLKLLLMQVLSGQLPSDKFASLGPNAPQNKNKPPAQSARKFVGNNRWDTTKNKLITGGRVMVFIAGGVSYTEMRDGYEVMNKENKEIIVGGTHITTPTKYMSDLLALDVSK